MKTMKAQLINPGTSQPQEIEPANGKAFTLEEMQKFVGGYVELIAQDRETLMLVNEEGRLLGLPVNEVATRVYCEWLCRRKCKVSLAQKIADIATSRAVPIVGPAVFCPKGQFE